jgi:hypothetical protein
VKVQYYEDCEKVLLLRFLFNSKLLLNRVELFFRPHDHSVLHKTERGEREERIATTESSVSELHRGRVLQRPEMRAVVLDLVQRFQFGKLLSKDDSSHRSSLLVELCFVARLM